MTGWRKIPPAIGSGQATGAGCFPDGGPAEFSVIRCDPESGTWSRSWTIRELDDRATAVRDLSWLESGALLHITYETEKDGTLTVDFVPDAELTDPGDLCGYPAE